MKIVFKAVTVAGLLLGIGATIHPTPVLATPDCSGCVTEEIECQEGNQSACNAWNNICLKFCHSEGTISGTPPSKHNEKLDVALLNSKRTIPQ
jgi:hypothetical protein